jgi:hypothetical protein
VARQFAAATGYGAPLRLILSDADFAQLASMLREIDLATLPENLYASMYTDLRVDILGRSRDLQARPYAAVSPSTHGKRQVAFDALIERLRMLAERVIAEGSATSAAE